MPECVCAYGFWVVPPGGSVLAKLPQKGIDSRPPCASQSSRAAVIRLLAIFLRTDCVARNLYDQSILVDQPAQVTAARELWLAQGGRLPIPFCGSLAKTLLPGGTTQNPYVQAHSGIRAQRAHEHHQ